MKNRAPKSAVQISPTPNKYCNLKTSKMDKSWCFIFTIVGTLKQTFLLQKGHKKKCQIKLLSHKNNKNKTEKS
jgi:hypothetical protein